MAVAVDPGGGANQHSPGNNKSANSQQWQNLDGMEQNVYEMGGDVNGADGAGNWADDTIERSGNLFGQLDSMIAAVQHESSALDSMREKLRELDGMRVQLSSLTKRLLEADQANLTLKSNLVKIQEAYADLRRQKQELESTMVPLRQELNRTKDAYSKERMVRLSAQQETSMLKDQLLRLEKINEDLERDVKSIPALADSNELLKTDLQRIRNRYKEEKASLTNSNNALLEHNRDLEASKVEIRGLAVRLLDLASQSSLVSSQRGLAERQHSGEQPQKKAPPHHQAMQWEQQQQQQQQQYQQYQQQQYQQHQQQQEMMSSGAGHSGGYGQYQPHLQQPMPISNVHYSGEKSSPGSVNNRRGLNAQDQPWLPQTLEEHMLGMGAHGGAHMSSPTDPNGFYRDDLSVGSQHTQHTRQSVQSMLQGSPPEQVTQQPQKPRR